MKFSTPNNHYWNLLLFFCSLHVSLKARSRRYKVKILYNIRINNNWIKILEKNPLRGWKKNRTRSERVYSSHAKKKGGRRKGEEDRIEIFRNFIDSVGGVGRPLSRASLNRFAVATFDTHSCRFPSGTPPPPRLTIAPILRQILSGSGEGVDFSTKGSVRAFLSASAQFSSRYSENEQISPFPLSPFCPSKIQIRLDSFRGKNRVSKRAIFLYCRDCCLVEK